MAQLPFQPIKIIGEYEIIVLQSNDNEIDALSGVSAKPLCRISFRLSCHPPNEWEKFFISAWKNPSPYNANWHDPQIASIEGDKVILSRTTEEIVKKYHREALDQAVEEANRRYQIFLKDKREQI
jgi:hypothetical protein